MSHPSYPSYSVSSPSYPSHSVSSSFERAPSFPLHERLPSFPLHKQVVEQLCGLKERLDAHLAMARRAAQHVDSLGGDPSLPPPPINLPRPVLMAAEELFVQRHGRPAADDFEALSLVRTLLSEAGIGGVLARQTALKRTLASLPPPPPSALQEAMLPLLVHAMPSTEMFPRASLRASCVLHE